MAYSYLHSSLSFPVTKACLDSVLDAPFTPASGALAETVAHCLTRLASEAETGITFYPDAPWLRAHLEFLKGFTYRELLLIRMGQTEFAVMPGESGTTDQVKLCLDSYALSHLAFLHLDAALAQALSPHARSECPGLFSFSPGGSDQHHHFVLGPAGPRVVDLNTAPRDTHPLINALRARPSSDKARLEWPSLREAAAREKEAGSPLLARWLSFCEERRLEAIAKASTSNTCKLGSSHYTDGLHVFHAALSDDTAALLLEGCDPRSFREVGDGEGVGHYACDQHGLWSWGRRLPCQFPENFAAVSWSGFVFSDGVHLYHDSEVLDDVDARNIRLIVVPGEEAYGFAEGFTDDAYFYWTLGGWHWAEVDTASFRALGRRYFIDKHHVYVLNDGDLVIQEGFDPASFRLFEHENETYLLDAHQVAHERGNGYQPVKMKGAKPASFRAVAGLPFVADDKAVWVGHKRCKDLDPATLSAVRQHPDMPAEHGYVSSADYFRNGGQVMQLGHSGGPYEAMAQADAASFELLHVPLARDSKHVWYRGRIVEGAQAGGFRWMDISSECWSDGRIVYVGGERAPEAWRQAGEQGRLKFPMHSVVEAGDAIYLKGKPVQGWRSGVQIHRSDDCYEDARFVYSFHDLWSGPILVWSKDFRAEPLSMYLLEDDMWTPEDDLHGLAAVTENGTDAVEAAQAVISPEEFEALAAGFPDDAEGGPVDISMSDPEACMTVWKSYSVSLKNEGQSSFSCSLSDATLTTSFYPVATATRRGRVRASLMRFLSSASPLSFEDLDMLEARIDPSQTLAVYDFDGKQLAIQNGEDNLRGVWLDEVMKDGRIWRGTAVLQDSGFLAGAFYIGPASAFGKNDDEFGRIEGDTAQREHLRALVRGFLNTHPPLRKDSNNGRKKIRTDDVVPADTYGRLLEGVSPGWSAALRNKLLKRIVEQSQVVDEDVEDHGVASWASPAGRAWDAFLEALESQDLLGDFNRQDPASALDLSRLLAMGAGLSEIYHLSDNAGGEAVPIALDFDVWLQARGRCLLWPHGGLRCDNDELYPAVVVPLDEAQSLQDLAESLGEGRRLLNSFEAFGALVPGAR